MKAILIQPQAVDAPPECPDACGGCSCHESPPCGHCTEDHDDIDGRPEHSRVLDIPAAFPYLRSVFPDSFDGIWLRHDVIGYVGDNSLRDGSVPNPAALDLADACYQAAAGRDYHTPIAGPMVILGVGAAGDSEGVPADFIAKFLPNLADQTTPGRAT